MYITIRIDYYSAINQLTQRGDFNLKGRKPEAVAFQRWKSIKKDTYKPKLMRVVINDNEDITESVRRLEQAPIPQDNLRY
ncbi:hypothetical protein ABE67_14145 [Cytobacillus firmus]|uniref:hypothetical protein n=1 Tax=Cytobacillus firmus TaxID=1399 RepID=UPI0018CE39B3|nr:hypothetical protein [Cytobacillus firmus]MBG9450434.1 hypothetical protein [Cytobacillus firmus]